MPLRLLSGALKLARNSSEKSRESMWAPPLLIGTDTRSVFLRLYCNWLSSRTPLPRS